MRANCEMTVSASEGTAPIWPARNEMPRKSVPRMTRHPDQRDAGVAAARLLEGGDAVRDGLDAGQRRGAAGEGVQEQEEA
ncbi:MAG: hypothetical protein M0C28_33380 [Candidatus Moduliflexus flocculans]|nr:hypothetical protein [Candidatus Moduliflexus flocculans]